MDIDKMVEKLADELDLIPESIWSYFRSKHWEKALDNGADPDDYNTVLFYTGQYFFG